MDKKLIENLLYEDESTTIDFKQDQYPFKSATNEQKSELLKDILAFSNAWRRSDAFIIIGVVENKRGKSTVMGIEKHLDEASIQQFVNKKINRPIDFSYHTFEIEAIQVGVIRIPLQERPFFLLNNYGKLNKGNVYIRRGSSTDIADPDEVAKMGRAMANNTQFPTFEVHFADSISQRGLGTTIELKSTILMVPNKSEIPSLGSHFLDITSYRNTDYYKEFADYLTRTSILNPVSFVLTNTGDVLIINAVMKFSFEKNERVILIDESEYPEIPNYGGISSLAFRNLRNIATREPTTTVYDRNDRWEVVVEFGSIQPKANAWSDIFYIGAAKESKIPLETSTYADNIPGPISTVLLLSINAEKQSNSVEDIIFQADEYRNN